VDEVVYKAPNKQEDVWEQVWNGMYITGKLGARVYHNCLLDTNPPKFDPKDKNLPSDMKVVCPNIPFDLDNLNPDEGGPSCPIGGGGAGARRRAAGGSCGGGGSEITYKPGPNSPTPCRSNCGELCTGFYCVANPTGVPPDFGDPNNPTNKPPVDSPTLSLPPLPTNSGCAPPGVTTTSVVCNGSGGHSVCQTTVICTTPPPTQTHQEPSPTPTNDPNAPPIPSQTAPPSPVMPPGAPVPREGDGWFLLCRWRSNGNGKVDKYYMAWVDATSRTTPDAHFCRDWWRGRNSPDYDNGAHNNVPPPGGLFIGNWHLSINCQVDMKVFGSGVRLPPPQPSSQV